MTLARPLRRARLLAVLSGVLVLLAWPTAAFGHATPIDSTPADGQVVTSSPTEMTVTFTEPVTLARGDNAVLDASGTAQPAGFTVQGSVLRISPETPLGDGTHVVTWRVVSADSHPVAGGFTFAVGEATPGAITVPVSRSQRELVVARAAAEALKYGGLLGFAGLLTFSRFLAPRAVRRHEQVRRRWHAGACAFAVSAVLGSLVLAPLTTAWEAGDSLSSVASPATWRAGLSSTAGVAAAMAALGIATAWAARARWPVLMGLGLALALVSTLPVGHTRSYGPWWLVLAADLLHVSAGAIWWGGLVGLAAVLATGSVPVRDRAAAVTRFSTVAAAVLGALGAAGIVLFWRIGGSFEALWRTPYGWVMLVKVALVVPVVGVAAWNRRVLLRRVAGRDARAAVGLLRRTVGAEALLLSAVLVVTGALVGQTPPPRADRVVVGVPTVQRLDLTVGQQGRAEVMVLPARRGTNVITLMLVDARGRPIDLVAPPELRVSLARAGVGSTHRSLVRTGPGRWEATADMPVPGPWRVTVAVRLSRFDEPVVAGDVDIP